MPSRVAIECKTIGPVDITLHDNRLSLRYSRAYRAKAALMLLLITAVAAGLLAYPALTILQGRFLEAITIALFLMIIGAVPLAWALSGWVHLLCYGSRAIIFDRASGLSSIPVLFGRRTIPEADIRSIRVERKRVAADTLRNIDASQLWTMHHTDTDAILLIMRDSVFKPQRLWGRLGLPHAAEQIAQEIATFLGRNLERRPARHFP